jgi:hypothetical protein
MRRLLPIAAALSLLTVAVGAWLARSDRGRLPSPDTNPSVVIRPHQLDFGGVWEQDQFVWPVEVENVTDRPQAVVSVSGSCACQTFEPRAFTLPPHGKQRVAVSLNLRQTESPNSAGETPFRVAIWAQVAGERKQLDWVLSGRVRQAVRVPQRLDLGRVSDLAPAKAAFTFGVPAYVPLGGLTVKSMGPAVEVESKHLYVGDRVHFNVTVTPNRGLPAGAHESNLVLTPHDPDGKPLPPKTVVARLTLGPDVQATPDLIYTGHREPGDTHAETITLHSVSGRTMTVTKAEAVGPGLTVTPLANADGLTTFAVEQVNQSAGQEAAAKFVVTLNTGETVALSVPVISAVPSVPRPEARK